MYSLESDLHQRHVHIFCRRYLFCIYIGSETLRNVMAFGGFRFRSIFYCFWWMLEVFNWSVYILLCICRILSNILSLKYKWLKYQSPSTCKVSYISLYRYMSLFYICCASSTKTSSHREMKWPALGQKQQMCSKKIL